MHGAVQQQSYNILCAACLANPERLWRVRTDVKQDDQTLRVRTVVKTGPTDARGVLHTLYTAFTCVFALYLVITRLLHRVTLPTSIHPVKSLTLRG
jgi:hypothetical protein